MRGSHIANGIFGLVIAGLAWIEAGAFPLQGLQEGLGAAFFPWLILGIIVFFSVVSLIYGVAVEPRMSFPFDRSPALTAAALLFAALCGFALAFVFFGLFVPVIVFLIVGMRILGASWLRAAIIGSLSGTAIYGLFVVGFGVPIP